MRWAKYNVSRYGGDPRDLVLIGHSAGAHLAALCLSDAQWLAEQGLVVSTPPPPPPPRSNTARVSLDESTTNRNSDRDTSERMMRETSQDRSTPTTMSEDAVKERTTTTTTTSQQQPPRGSQSASSLQSARSRSLLRRSPPPPPSPPPLHPPLAPPVVTGFVGISGVYDIPRMAGNVIGQMLARAAFGDERRAWRRVSPVHVVLATGAGPRAGSLTAPDDGTAAVSDSTARLSPQAAGSARETPRSSPPVGGDEEGSNTRRVGADDGLAVSTSSGGESSEHPGQKRTDHVRDEHGASSSSAPQERISRVEKTPVPLLYSSLCPLVTTDVLLITASSDFHLREDAEALAQALEGARREMTATFAGPRRSRKLTEGQSDNRTGLDRNAAASVAMAGGGGGGDNRVEGRKRGATGNEDCGREGCSDVCYGSVRHVCLQGEDHLSTIVSFGEQGKESFDVVLGFILGLPRPPPPSR